MFIVLIDAPDAKRDEARHAIDATPLFTAKIIPYLRRHAADQLAMAMPATSSPDDSAARAAADKLLVPEYARKALMPIRYARAIRRRPPTRCLKLPRRRHDPFQRQALTPLQRAAVRS